MRYFDASALAKLILDEEHSAALRSYFLASPERWSCGLIRVELARIGRIHGPSTAARAVEVIDRLSLIRLDDVLLTDAGAHAGVALRSLDAIHVAAAQTLGADLEALVTYDRRMLEAAQTLGIRVAAPT